MVKLGWIAIAAAAVLLTGCQKYKYTPYLPPEYRGNPEDPDPTLPGVFTGKKGEYVIYGK